MIDTGALLELLWAGAAAGLVLVAATALAIRGTTRSGAARRAGHTGRAAGNAVLAGLAMLVCAGGVVLGLTVMLDKG